jgi:hypothetical protein
MDMMTMVDRRALRSPELSVLVIAPGDAATVAKTVGNLHAQDHAERIEVLIAYRQGVPFDVRCLETERFTAVKAVAFDQETSRASIKASCLPLLNAPVVAYIEDHAYPAPGWADALIKAHREGWAAVGYAVENANPDSAYSWANLYITYGPYVGAEGAEVRMLAGENVSYRREILQEMGSELTQLMEHEYFLHERLRARGLRLYVANEAEIAHLNKDRMWTTATENWAVGRNFGRSRSSGWPLWRRLLYAGGAFLLPFIKGRRIFAQIRQSGKMDLLPRILPALGYALAVNSLAEMWAYLFGAYIAPSRR